MSDVAPDDAMVPIAILLGRSEALTVAAMLDAAGIIVHVGGEHHTSVMANIIALGGFRLTVPAWQHAEASGVIAGMLGSPAPEFSRHMQRAIGRLVLAIIGSVAVFVLPYAAIWGAKGLLVILASPLFMLGIPVNPQGRGDYFLSAPALPGGDMV